MKCIFLIAVHDRDIDDLVDTVSSIRHYNSNSYLIVCINDCQDPENVERVRVSLADERVIHFIPKCVNDWPRNTFGSLFCKKYQGIEFILEHVVFDFLIGLDTDALITDFGLVHSIEEYFREYGSKTGLLGSYRRRADGKRRTRWEWALYILYLVYLKREIPRKSLLWRSWVREARNNGYRLGEHVLGGAFVFSYECIKRIVELHPYRLMLDERIFDVAIGDDVLFSMLTFSSNYKIADFGRPQDPAVIAQDFLPVKKEEIARKKKKIIHSLKRGKDGEGAEELRRYFMGLRK